MDAAGRLGAYGVYISGAGPTIMAIVDEKNTLFPLQIRRQLKALGLGGWRVEELHIDNRGAQIVE